MVNVAVQIETLTRHQSVGDAYRRGALDVIGVFYDIPSATVFRVTPTAVDPVAVVEG